ASSDGCTANGMPVDRLRYCQSQIVAQRRADIFLLEQTAPLQFRYQQPHDVIIAAWHARSRHHKTIASRRREPFLHLISSLMRASAKHRVFLDRATAGDIDEIAHCRVLLAGVTDHPVAEPLKR